MSYPARAEGLGKYDKDNIYMYVKDENKREIYVSHQKNTWAYIVINNMFQCLFVSSSE